MRLVAITGLWAALFANSAAAQASGVSDGQALAHAILQNQVEVVRTLLAKGISPNLRVPLAKEDQWFVQSGADPAPPLIVLAASFGSPDSVIVKMLLEKGADPNAADKLGNTPLMKAAELGWMSSIDPLLAKGAKVNARRADGATPLMLAQGNLNLAAVARLIEKGADINAKDAAGSTPLHYAIRRAQHNPMRIYGRKDKPEEDRASYLSLIQFLIDHGAKVDTKDKSGQTPLDVAVSLGRTDAADVLRKAAWE
jgi:ankyrin repeat protein